MKTGILDCMWRGALAVFAVAASIGTPALAAPAANRLPPAGCVLVRADIAESDLPSIEKKPFCVFVVNTSSSAIEGVELAVVSDQFNAKVEPSPVWKRFPSLAPKSAGSFTVSLVRKPGATGPCDVILKIYSKQGGTTQLTLCATISEAIDEHVIPLLPRVALDGKTSPTAWGRSLSLTRFPGFTKQEANWSGSSPARSRLQLAADSKNLFLFVCFMWVGKTGQFHFQTANGLDAKPVIITVDRKTGDITSDPPIEGMRCRKCDDDPLMLKDPKDPVNAPPAAMYECSIPRAALGITANGVFFANADFQAGTITSCWRGDPDSVEMPAIYGRFVIQK